MKVNTFLSQIRDSSRYIRFDVWYPSESIFISTRKYAIDTLHQKKTIAAADVTIEQLEWHKLLPEASAAGDPYTLWQ